MTLRWISAGCVWQVRVAAWVVTWPESCVPRLQWQKRGSSHLRGNVHPVPGSEPRASYAWPFTPHCAHTAVSLQGLGTPLPARGGAARGAAGWPCGRLWLRGVLRPLRHRRIQACCVLTRRLLWRRHCPQDSGSDRKGREEEGKGGSMENEDVMII